MLMEITSRILGMLYPCWRIPLSVQGRGCKAQESRPGRSCSKAVEQQQRLLQEAAHLQQETAASQQQERLQQGKAGAAGAAGGPVRSSAALVAQTLLKSDWLKYFVPRDPETYPETDISCV